MKKIDKNVKKKKVCIALSGGVDSAVAAALLSQAGYDCLGIFMKLWHDPNAAVCRENLCCSTQAFEDARKVAHKLGFKLYTFNYSKPFKQKVVDYFLDEYQKGNTPNPCIACNKFIKFDLLLKTAKSLGCDFLATGHYLKIKKNKSGIYQLYQGRDQKKDQSYFLYNLKQKQLKSLIFPLGDYTKDEVRSIAKKFNLPVYQKPESQEICFIPENNRREFFKRYLNSNPGSIINQDKKEIGKHQGYFLYTPGQRKGLNLAGGPYYITKIYPKKNQILVTKNLNDQKLYSQHFKIKSENWISTKPKSNKLIQVKIRHQSKPIKAKIKGSDVYLSAPARSIAVGQSAVFYDGKQLLGGGIIKSVIS